MTSQLDDILVAISFLNFILFAMFLLTQKKGKFLSNRLFAFFLLLKAYCYLDQVWLILRPDLTVLAYRLHLSSIKI